MNGWYNLFCGENVEKNVQEKFTFWYYVKSIHIRSYSGQHFSRIRTKYGEILRISPYSARMRENVGKMRTRITPNRRFLHSVVTWYSSSTRKKMLEKYKTYCKLQWRIQNPDKHLRWTVLQK